ncbi:hypothetical protein [Streptomyces sp. NPDC023588]|uniref:hypothetical protein n=1 Tax=Streptomyces sp. NPDC023588 TaxID=3154907 RepID=UPI00340D0A42
MALVAPQIRARQMRGPQTRTDRFRVDRFRVDRFPAGRLAAVFTAAGVALVPWVLVLARTVPQTTGVSHWATAWIGLDLVLAAGLTGTGALLRKRDPRVSPLAAATAALLLMDAWFDVTTSAGGDGRTTALLLAAGAELPLAVALAVVAARTARTPAGVR